MKIKNILIFVLMSCIFLAIPGSAQESEAKLAKAAQNPVAAMISLPFQNNTNFGFGLFDRTQNVLNIQPVIPFSGKKWNVIVRTIAPLVSQPDFASPSGGTFGLGDINPTFFLSPAKPGKVIWGIGPTFLLPTATDKRLGTGKWAAGPSVVLLAMPGKWVVGVLASNVWSFAGKSDRNDVNQTVIQYFINYNMANGWYLASAPIITANWKAGAGNRWTVPFGIGIGRIFRLGKQPVNVSIHGYYNAVHPDNIYADWQLRTQFQFLFPKR